MNFFGHAVVAWQVDDDPAFLLGAMAPDLLGMCGAAAERPTCQHVAAGQAHHLAVDAAFHGSATFLAIQSWAARSLIAAGVRRGPARGAAHVGVELLLDGVLAGDRRARAAYDHSLADADTSGAPFIWVDGSSAARWQTLVRRLRCSTIPDAYREPDFVTDRLVGALGRRPRLALDPVETAILRAFLPALQRRVEIDADRLVQPAPAPCIGGAQASAIEPP